MKWNLRLAAANRGIWTASELQRMLAAAGLKISAGKMSGPWSGRPASIKLSDLDVICAVVGCGVEEPPIPEPVQSSQVAGEPHDEQAAASPRPSPPSPPGAVTGARSRPPDDRADPCRHPLRQLPGLPVLGILLRLAVVLPGLL